MSLLIVSYGLSKDLCLNLRIHKENRLVFALVMAVGAVDTNIDNAKAPQQNKPRRKKPPTTKYIACSSSQELTRALEFSLQDTDVVAELGAQLRDVSQTICKFAKKAVLVDVSRKVPHQVEQKSRAMRRPGLDELQLASHATFM